MNIFTSFSFWLCVFLLFLTLSLNRKYFDWLNMNSIWNQSIRCWDKLSFEQKKQSISFCSNCLFCSSSSMRFLCSIPNWIELFFMFGIDSHLKSSQFRSKFFVKGAYETTSQRYECENVSISNEFVIWILLSFKNLWSIH